MPYPQAGRLANQARDIHVLNEVRRPVAVKMMSCRHSDVLIRCSICMREREIELGRIAQRL